MMRYTINIWNNVAKLVFTVSLQMIWYAIVVLDSKKHVIAVTCALTNTLLALISFALSLRLFAAMLLFDGEIFLKNN